MKTAFLVSFCPMTRVVIEVADPENLTEAEQDKLVALAREQIMQDATNKLNGENIDEVRLDDKCPYGFFDEDSEPDDDTDPTLKAALDYVRGQIDEDELEVIRATVTRNLGHHYPIADGVYDDHIIDLLEEYGDDNDLSEGWWMEFGEIEDILLLI